MHIPHGWTPVISAAPRKISFSGTRWGTAHESVWIGRGRLADLVELYEHYREALFGKNVRTYLHQEAKKPGSAAQAIRGALESICKGTPNLYFTMAHNGVTLTAPEVKEVSVESVEVSPHGLGMHILNGCQTVHTAWRFRRSCEDRESKDGDRSWREVWREIWIPLRLVATTDEERVRAVTVAANRQTAMRSSAFWAHDAVQIALDRRLGGRGIYYERQESAWENLQDSGSPSLQNYQNGVINIEVLARVIAAAAPDVIVEHTRSPSGIFDNELAYRKVFAPEKLRSTRLLVALVNFQQAVHLALRDLAEVPPTVGMPAKKFQYAIFRLAAMWIAKNDPQWLLAEGDRVYKQQSAAQKDLRERTVKLLGQSHMNIQTVLRGIWRSGDDWCDPYSAKLLKQAASSLRLSQSPFDIDAPADP